MTKGKLQAHIIRTIRRVTVVVAATTIILTYIYLLNYFAELFGAGQGWGNPLLWFASAMVALAVVFSTCWLLTKACQWLISKFKTP